jgi:hypothetical protein
MGVVTFLYTGLGAGNLVLGVLALFLNFYFLKRLFDLYRSSPRNAIATEEPCQQATGQSIGSVEQLVVTDLTDYVTKQTEPSAYSPPSYYSQHAENRSVSQGSDQTSCDYSTEKYQPTKIYASRTRTSSAIETEI